MAEKRGDPFETKELQKQRARQRYVMRTIPPGYLARVRPVGELDPENVPFLEIELRRIFDEQTAALSELLSRFEASIKTRTLASFANSRTMETNYFERRKHPFAKEAATYGEEPSSIEIPEDVTDDFLRLVWSGMWADELATDGYEDPRLVRRKERVKAEL